MAAVADPVFMGNLFLSHSDMYQRIAFIKEIVVAAINIPSHGSLLIILHGVDQPEDAVFLKIGLFLGLGNIACLPEPVVTHFFNRCRSGCRAQGTGRRKQFRMAQGIDESTFTAHG